MLNRRKIGIFTGNRAEYGLLYPVIKAVHKNKALEYSLLVSGAHLDSNFGNTLKEIKEDGFKISQQIKIDLVGDTLFHTTQAIGSGIISISKAIKKIRPDMLIVYADRFEGLAAVIAGSQMNIPTVHIEGGDITEGGALDDSIRHAMTKLAHIHFTTNTQASERRIAMGEEEWRVHTVGYPTIDLIKNEDYMNEDDVINKFGLNMNAPLIIFTQHSVTTEYREAKNQVIPF